MQIHIDGQAKQIYGKIIILILMLFYSPSSSNAILSLKYRMRIQKRMEIKNFLIIWVPLKQDWDVIETVFKMSILSTATAIIRLTEQRRLETTNNKTANVQNKKYQQLTWSCNHLVPPVHAHIFQISVYLPAVKY